MDVNILTDEEWSELGRAVSIYDQKGDRTTLDPLLVPIMRSMVDSLDDNDYQASDVSDADKQLVMVSIESELAEIINGNGCASWCCHRRRRIQPFGRNNSTKFSDYLINLARAKPFDRNNSGFLSKENIKLCFGSQLSREKMAKFLRSVPTNSDGDVKYADLATKIFLNR